MNLRKRIEKAIKAERGLRLSAAECHGLANALGILTVAKTEPKPLTVPLPNIPEPKVQTHIRWMIRRDLPECVEMCGNWQEEHFLRALRQRNCIGMVAEKDNAVVGFVVYEIERKKMNILNLVAAPTLRRSGVGTSIMRKMVGKLSPKGRTYIEMELPECNLPGQQFLSKMGFQAFGTRVDDEGETLYQFRYGQPASTN